jgi:hypothetical protein
MEKGYKYDVAFSFCHEDESLATELNDLICDRYKTFIYYEQQKRLAGKDGEIEFKKIFSNDSRVVVILYRDNWGKTQFTRYECDAIRERGAEQSYDFTLFIPTEKKFSLPPWFPKYRLWYLLKRYGIEGAASVIEARIQENNGTIKEEIASERAKRLKRKIKFNNERELFVKSPQGYKAAMEELKNLFNTIKNIASDVSDSVNNFHVNVQYSDTYLSINCKDYAIELSWEQPYSNSILDTCLHLRLIKPMRQPSDLIVYSSKKLLFDINENKESGFKDNTGKFYSAEMLANYVFKFLFEKVEGELNS